MNRLLKAAAALVCAVGLTASASVVTATVTDTDLQTWNNGTFTATLLISGQPGVVPTVSGVPVSKLKVTGTMSASGVITATLTDTSTVDQKAVWMFEIHSNTSAPSVTVSTQVIGSTPNLTPAFSQLTAPRFATGDTAYGYLDSEVVNPLVGSSYFNTGSTTPGYRQYSLSGWQGGSGGGGGGAAFPSTAGVVCNTSTTASTTCSPGQVVAAISTTPVASSVTSANTNDSRLATAVQTVNGKSGPSIQVNSFDVGAVTGPIAGSGTWANTLMPIAVDASQTRVPFVPPTNADCLQIAYANGSGVAETGGPQMTIRVGLEYPQGTYYPVFFSSKRDAVIDPQGVLISDPICLDFSGLQVAYVRTLAQKTDITNTTPFPVNYIGDGLNSTLNPAVLAPNVDSVNLYFEGTEALTLGTYADGVTTAASTTFTSASAPFSPAPNQYIGQTISIPGAGVAGATLVTTIAGAASTSSVTLAVAATTAVAGGPFTITATDKTLGPTAGAGKIANASTAGTGMYGPWAILGQTVSPKSAALVGDSITYGITFGASPLTGSWAVQALSQSNLAVGRSTVVMPNIPFVQASQPSDTIQNYIVRHAARYSLLGRANHVLGMLGTNDLSALRTSAQMEADLITLWSQQRARGQQPFYGTIIAQSTSTDGWITTANQTTATWNGTRVTVDTWMRDGAPMDCTTLAPAATGTTSSNATRTTFYSLTGTILISPSGPCAHPAQGLFELAWSVESAHDSGLWLVGAARTVTDAAITTGTGILTSATAAFTSADVGKQVSVVGAGAAAGRLNATITTFTSATQVTLGTAAGTTVTGASLTIGQQYTNNDGLHPSAIGHAAMGVAAGATVATW